MAIEGDHNAILRCHNIIHKYSGLWKRIGFSEHLPYPYIADNAPVSPVILPLDMQPAFCKNRNLTNRIPSPQDIFPRGIALLPGVSAYQHS